MATTHTARTVTTQVTRISLNSDELEELLRKHFELELGNANISVDIDISGVGYLRGVDICATTVTHS